MCVCFRSFYSFVTDKYASCHPGPDPGSHAALIHNALDKMADRVRHDRMISFESSFSEEITQTVSEFLPESMSPELP